MGNHQPVGSLKGSFSVGGDGSANYSIPIDLPKGTGGMEPKISLSYSSGGGNGIAGLGFDLSGLQSITRGGTSLSKDGFSNPIDFQPNDRFFLNGERLVCVAGNYGEHGSEYRTEMDSFARVRLTGNANQGVSSWKVETKAGLILEFGNTVDSRLMPSSGPAPISWAIKKASDTTGNFYQVNYVSDVPQNVDEVVNHRVDEISYTGNSRVGLSPSCSVRYVYENRPDISFAYHQGKKILTSKTLKEIRVSTGSYLNHRYVLSYMVSDQSNRSLLTQVQKFVGNDQPVPPTKIDWDTLAPGSAKWAKQSGNVTSYPIYGTNQEATGAGLAYMSVTENGRGIRLVGDVSRAIPFPQNGSLRINPDTVVEFEFRGENLDFGALLTLDEDLIENNQYPKSKSWLSVPAFIQTKNAAIRIGGTGASPAWVSESVPYVSSEWRTYTFPIGKYKTDNSTSVKYLGLMNSDDNPSNGAAVAEFRNIRIRSSNTTFRNRNGDATVEFALSAELPRLLDASSQDRGVRFFDINADGLNDIVDWRVVDFDGQTNALQTNWQNRALKPNVQASVMLNTGGEFTQNDSQKPPAGAFLAISGSGENPGWWVNRHDLLTKITDINGDGNPDLLVPSMDGYWKNESRKSYRFYTFVEGGWQPMSVYNQSFPYRSKNASSSGEYGGAPHTLDQEFIDMDADSYVDMVVSTSPFGSLVTPDESTTITGPNSRTVFLNKVHLGLGWIRSDALALPDSFREYVDGYPKPKNGIALADLNDDGLPDYTLAKGIATPYWQGRAQQTRYSQDRISWLMSAPSDPSKQPGWKPPIYDYSINSSPQSAWTFPFAGATSSPDGHPVLCDLHAKDAGTRLVDLNGDGLLDLLRADTVRVEKVVGRGGAIGISYVHSHVAWYNKGAGNSSTGSAWIQDPRHVLPVSLISHHDGVSGSEILDLNGDGLADILISRDYVAQEGPSTTLPFNATNNGAFVNTGSGWREDSSWGLPDGYRLRSGSSASPAAQFVDINGDGFADLLAGLHANGIPNVYINQCRQEKIRAVTDGFGKDVQIEYHRLNDPSPTPGFKARVYEKNFAALPDGQMAQIDGRLVVSRYSEPDGRGGRRYKSQRYGDLRYDRKNETSLGFGWVEALDELNGQWSRTEMSREYPFAGSPLTVQTKVRVNPSDVSPIFPGVSAGMKLVSLETSGYAEMPPQTGIGGTIRRPVQTSSVKHTFDLDGTLKIETKTTQNLKDFDSYGFVKKSTVESLDGSKVVSVNVYNHTVDATRWHLGRLSQSTVTKSGAGKPSITKTAAFTYSASTGLLTTETAEPGHPLSSTKTYTHDAFGNVVQTTVSTSGETRFSTTQYDAKGRFVIGEKNQLNHGTTYQYDTQKSLLLSTTDLAGKTTRFYYDSFGTLIRTDHPDGTQTGEITGFATNAALPSSVASWLQNGIQYFRAKESSGAPVAKVYLDASGRELVSETTILRNATATGAARYSKIYAVSVYDSLGRKVAASNAFAAGETAKFTYVSYDLLDRALVTQHPDGGFERIQAYGAQFLNGQPVTYSKVLNRNGKALERWEDEHGRLIQSRDPSNQITRFYHDHEGRLTSVSIDGATLLTNTFDLLGNKTAVWEANSGSSSSTYDGLGQVVSSTNANNQTTHFTYDILGRPVTVQKPEGTYHTYYDQARGNGLGKAWKTTGPSGYLEEISYDSFGRPLSTRKTQFGETFTTSTTYDVLGRPLTETDAGGLTVVHGYDPLYSFPVSLTMAGGRPGNNFPGAGTVLWQAGQFDSSGRALNQTLAQGVTAAASYHPTNGLLIGLSASRNGTVLQQKTYGWDTLGNLSNRNDFIAGRSETFTYDSLNRLTQSAVSSHSGAPTTTVPPPENYTYAPNGNLLTKGSATLNYNGSRPHAVTSATIKGQNRDYVYDAAGYVLSDRKRTYTWTSFGQLASVSYETPATFVMAPDGQSGYALSGQTVFSSFEFDAGGNRARQITGRGQGDYSQKRQTITYLGSYEREVHESPTGSGTYQVSKTIHRHSLGGIGVYTRTETASATAVKLITILKDHLGSTDLLLTGSWNGQSFSAPTVEHQAFDAWGERRDAAQWTAGRTNGNQSFLTSGEDYRRGYTGHEQLDDSGLIHMNGRIYDPELGRMLSPDPFVQVPEYSQNFNRFSYVMNNPLNMTDPSGFSWLSKAFHKVKSWVKKNWRTIVVIVVGVVLVATGFGAAAGAALLGSATASATAFTVMGTAVTYGAIAGGAIVGGIMGGLSAALNGGDLGDILRGATIGAVQGAISSGVLHGMGEAAAGTFSGIDDMAHVVGHGVVGGASNVAMGGKFSDGFLSAAAGAAAGYLGAYKHFQGSGGLNVAGRTAIAGVVGGTTSVLGGGKFANGAYTSAFEHLLNAEMANPNGGWDESPPKAIPVGEEVLRFDGFGVVGYGSNSQPITSGTLTWFGSQGEILEQFDIRTGGLVIDPNKPAGSDTQVRNGRYSVSRWASSRPGKPTFTDFDKNLSYSLNVDPKGWGARKIWQSLIRIHPDGPIRNGLCTQPGTAGCLGVTNSNNSHARFFNRANSYFKTRSSIDLYVNSYR